MTAVALAYLLGPPVLCGILLGGWVYSQTDAGGVIPPIVSALAVGGGAALSVLLVLSGLHLGVFVLRTVGWAEGWGWWP